MSEFFLPVNSSNAVSVVPPEDQIMESTWFGCQALVGYNRISSWGTHAIVTNTGVAFNTPAGFPLKPEGGPMFLKWGEGYSMTSLGKLGMNFVLGGITFKLIRNEQKESREDFKARGQDFIAKFRPLFIEQKIKWIEEHRGDADKKTRKHIKAAEKMINKMIKQEKKRLSK